MEFEEVNNLIKAGHVHPGALPSSSLPWHPAFGVAPHTATPGTSGTYYVTTNTTSNSDTSKRAHHHHHHYRYHRRHGTRRQKPILGVTRLVNSVRRLKKPKEEEEPWHITVSPLGRASFTQQRTNVSFIRQ